MQVCLTPPQPATLISVPTEIFQLSRMSQFLFLAAKPLLHSGFSFSILSAAIKDKSSNTVYPQRYGCRLSLQAFQIHRPDVTIKQMPALQSVGVKQEALRNKDASVLHLVVSLWDNLRIQGVTDVMQLLKRSPGSPTVCGSFS